MSSCYYYIIPIFILAASSSIASWTAWVVQDEHSKNTFDSPNHLPYIMVSIGIMAVFIFISTLFRLVSCSTSGFCATGLSFVSFTIMIVLATVLFTQIGLLNKSEHDYYHNELEHYYELAIGQCCYFALYFLLAISQGIFRLCGCCSSCVKRDEYDTFDEGPLYV
jgi:hypothetical protein